jgi:hypothetical protein
VRRIDVPHSDRLRDTLVLACVAGKERTAVALILDQPSLPTEDADLTEAAMERSG